MLDSKRVDEIFVCGLAFDYCVMDTAIDGAELFGYNTKIIIDACRAISNEERDVKYTNLRLWEAGVTIVNSEDPDLFNVV